MINKKPQAKEPLTEVINEPVSVKSVVDAKKKKLAKAQKLAKINCPKCNRAFKIQSSLDKHLQGCTGKIGGGMPPGKMLPKTIEMRDAKKKMQEAIAGMTGELIAAQRRQALGGYRLMKRFKVEREYGRGKNKTTRQEWHVERVTDDEDFMLYLSLDHNSRGEAKDKDLGVEYFYFAKPDAGNTFALANMLDRAYGRPKESLEVSEDPEAPITPIEGGTSALKRQVRDILMEATKAKIEQRADSAQEGTTV